MSKFFATHWQTAALEQRERGIMPDKLPILIVEDDETTCILIEKILRGSGLAGESVYSGAEAIAACCMGSKRLLILDYQLGDMTGQEVIVTLAAEEIFPPFVVMTGHGDEMVAVEMMKLGALDYIVKDLNFADMLPSLIQRALDRLKVDEKLRQSEDALVRDNRMAAVGQLASGIAHEINNPLATISACVEFIEGQREELSGIGPKGEKIINYLQLIKEETGRAADIISDLLDFSRIRSKNITKFRICEMFRSTILRFRVQSLYNRYHFVEKFADDLPEFEGDRENIRQIIINLLVNAVESMPEGGTVTVSLAWDEGNAESIIGISDEGMGIPVDIQDRIFQPFFTTKIDQSGTGLGLSVVHSIVSEHKGSIEVESNPVRGSTFTVRLPV